MPEIGIPIRKSNTYNHPFSFSQNTGKLEKTVSNIIVLFKFSLENVEIVERKDGFNIFYGGVEIASHSNTFPMMAVGRGVFEAEEHLGNFELSDSMTEKFELQEWEISKQSSIFDE